MPSDPYTFVDGLALGIAIGWTVGSIFWAIIHYCEHRGWCRIVDRLTDVIEDKLEAKDDA